MAGLVSQHVVQVELAGLEPGATPGIQVRALSDAEIEIVTDGPLTVPALIRLSVDSSALGDVLDLEEPKVRWDLVLQ
jgi:hypothetical protein